MSNGGICTTAPATPGLLNESIGEVGGESLHIRAKQEKKCPQQEIVSHKFVGQSLCVVNYHQHETKYREFYNLYLKHRNKKVLQSLYELLSHR